MNEIKFEVGKTYYSFVAGEMFECVERTDDTATFLRETGAKHTLRTGFSSGGIEYARLGFILLSALTGES